MDLILRACAPFTFFMIFSICQSILTTGQENENVANDIAGTKIVKDLRHTINEILSQNGDSFVDPCASAPCLNAGKCTVTSYSALTYSCQCGTGYTGQRCERGQNECLSNPCNHGTCVDNIGSFSCRCDLGFTGILCDQDTDECLSSPCLNGGTCAQGLPGRFTCICPRGFRGTRCQMDIDECLSLSPCQNGGRCRQEAPGDYSCMCPLGFSGKDCELLPDPCASNPCQNGGLCSRNHSLNTWQCQCATDFTGSRCEHVVNPCLGQSQCGQGVCMPSPGGQFRCQCPRGVAGPRCETVTDPCSSDPCRNGGRCINRTFSAVRYRCDCLPNFIGSNCQTLRNVCDEENAGSWCQNGGSCIVPRLGQRPRCLCPHGFSGLRCEWLIDPCMSTPCLQNATCRRDPDMPGGFLCSCQTGYFGSSCQGTIAATSDIPITTPVFPMSANWTNATYDGDVITIYRSPIDPTTLFILLGAIGVLALIIGGAILLLTLIRRRRPDDFCLALPWTLFRSLEPRVFGECVHGYNNDGMFDYTGNPHPPSAISFYESPKPPRVNVGDYTFRRY